MSVINQVLVELEKRRASGTERGTLPDHVRALPDGGDDTVLWRLAVGCAVAIVVVGLIWLAAERYGFPRVSPNVAPAPAVAETVIEKVVLASAAAGERPGADGGSEPATGPGPVSRLSFELAHAPAMREAVEAPPAPVMPRAAVAAARVLSREGEERASAAPAERPAAPASAAARESARPPEPAPAQAPPLDSAQSRPRAVDKPAAVAGAKGEIEKQVRQPTQREAADQEYRRATALLQQGRLAEAQDAFRAALQLQPGHHGARQAMVALMLESKAHGEAERALHEGLKLAPEQTGFAMTLARLQVERGDNAGAIATLQGSVPHAQASPDYLAFLGALLQRQGRHEDAIQQFSAALRGKPNSGVWWLGLAMSLQALNRGAEAQEAYRRAKAGNLNPELAAFADQRLRQLQ